MGPSATANDVIKVTPNSGASSWSKSAFAVIDMPWTIPLPRHPRQRKSRRRALRSEEHTSELQSLRHLVCRLLLEKKKKHTNTDGTAESQTRACRSCRQCCRTAPT